jgi:hypothetical protein
MYASLFFICESLKTKLRVLSWNFLSSIFAEMHTQLNFFWVSNLEQRTSNQCWNLLQASPKKDTLSFSILFLQALGLYLIKKQ